MNIINILDKQTIDKIAAGEVVDRPSSIVKELCENSIDAGCNAISVEIIDGGTSLIRVTDNGSGILKDEVKKAFLRHATSKIENSGDLSFIKTLGFRGEALSSIAAVSKLELLTKTVDSLTGCIYKINGGEEILFEEAGLPDGTTVIVKDLFYNTPARLKFLKSAKTETSYINEIIEKTALAHPEISFKFKSNQSIKFSTSGNGNLKDAIYSVYGKDIASRLIEVDVDYPLLSIKGYIGLPELARGNRGFENYFINGRYVKDKVIESAIEEAYKSYQMKGTFPFTAFNIIIEPELIDVNVHPSKMEIRFFNNKKIYESILEILTNAINNSQKIPEVKLLNNKDVSASVNIPEPFEINRRKEIFEDSKFKEDTIYNVKSSENSKAYSYPVKNSKDSLSEDSFSFEHEDIKYTEAVQETLFNDVFLSENARIRHRIIGDIFDTYWIVEYDEKIYIIDQHAAHEKVLYEELLSKIKNNDIYSQKLLVPFIITLNHIMEETLSNCLPQFEKLGFEIEPFGEHDYQISAVPMSLYGLNDKEQIILMLDELSGLKTTQSFDVLLDKVAQVACKAAVKGGGKLSISEADHLIDMLLKLENPYNCPHGRPTIIMMSKSELEKKFKRIV